MSCRIKVMFKIHFVQPFKIDIYHILSMDSKYLVGTAKNKKFEMTLQI